jgi:hypothetical protein
MLIEPLPPETSRSLPLLDGHAPMSSMDHPQSGTMSHGSAMQQQSSLEGMLHFSSCGRSLWCPFKRRTPTIYKFDGGLYNQHQIKSTLAPSRSRSCTKDYDTQVTLLNTSGSHQIHELLAWSSPSLLDPIGTL